MALPGEENPRPREKLGEGTESKNTPLSTDNAREEIELSRKKEVRGGGIGRERREERG